MIPEEKSLAVARALQGAFGVTEFEDIRMLTRGNTTALVYRIVVAGVAYLMKILMRKDSIGPARQFGCMCAAADVGVAPRVLYTSVEDGISITDFVEETPLAREEAVVRLPVTLRTLHALPPFPGVVNHLNTTYMFLMHEGPARDGFVQRIRASGIFAENPELFEWYAQAAAVYPHDEADMVSSHNDLFKPDNIVFDGQRVWLVDWEAAFLNDRYADLAAVANLVVRNESEELVFLREYFGCAPDEYQLARFYLAWQVAHMFYAMAFLLLGSAGKPVEHHNFTAAEAPEFEAFQRRLWAGELNLAESDAKVLYGRAHWARLVRNMRQPRFREVLRIVGEPQRRSSIRA